MDNKVTLYLCLIVFGVGIFILLILLLLSFSSLEYTELGLDYSGITKTIDSNPYKPGIHFLGIGHSFIKYPKVVQTMEFSQEKNATSRQIKSRTKDGLEVELEISFQYLIIPNEIYSLYLKFGESYEEIYVVTAIDILTDIATKFEAYQFFYARQLIGNSMKDALDEAFKKYCYSSIEFFQLRTVDLPDLFEDAIQESEVKKQDIEKAKAERSQIQIELSTQIQQSEFAKNATINSAEGKAQAILKQNEADVESLLITQTNKALAYSHLKQGLNLDNEQLLNYMKIKILTDYTQQQYLAISIDHING